MKSVRRLEEYYNFVKSPGSVDRPDVADRRYKEIGEWILRDSKIIEAELKTSATKTSVKGLAALVIHQHHYSGWGNLVAACERLLISAGPVSIPIVKEETSRRGIGSFFEGVLQQLTN